MMMLRRAEQRYHETTADRNSWYSYDPRRLAPLLALGMGELPKLAEVLLAPGARMPAWANGPAEILTHVLEGTLAQADASGHTGVLQTGEFQRMSIDVRTNLTERNASPTAGLRVLRLFMQPAGPELSTRREQQRFPFATRRGVLRLIASADGHKDSLQIRQPAEVYASTLDVRRNLIHALSPDHVVWLHILRGEVTLDDLVLDSGDSIGVALEPAISFRALDLSEILLLDLGPVPSVA
ncbi:MAG: hypothetical protein KC518_13185 [Candidatus Cloacimonetes bacterium]|nr:hypothetical protein [Candidatus Cloacimonadota bacterium]